jgi:hypothetical protein
MGVTGTHDIPRPPGNNNFRVLAPAPRSSATRSSYRQHGDQLAAARRAGRLPADRLRFQGCKSGAKWSTLYTEIPKGEATGNLEVRPSSQALQIQHDDSGKVTGVLYANKDGKRQVQLARVVAAAGN